jgi:hypothetical protein
VGSGGPRGAGCVFWPDLLPAETGTGSANPWAGARGVVGVEELVAEAEKQGIKHGMDLAAFRA